MGAHGTWYADADWWVAIGTCWLAVATTVLALYTYRLFRSTRDIALDARQASDSQRRQMAEAISHSARAADIARTAMIAQNRAYVRYDGCRWFSHPDLTDGSIFWSIHPKWFNSGDTPTRETYVYAHYDLRDDPLPDDYSFSEPQVTLSPISIGANSGVTSGAWNLEGEDILAIREGKKHFYIWGIARYRDVFDDTPLRETRFCVYIRQVFGDPLKPYSNGNEVDLRFVNYHRHNDAT